MAVKERVVKVWIEPGCIVCDACETACPEVFDVQETTCVIRPEALNAEFTKPLTPSIAEAAEECPVDVIKFETVQEEVAEGAPAEAAPAAAAAPAAEPVAAAAAPATHAPKAAPVPAAAAVAATAAPRDEALQSVLESAKARGGRATLQKVDPGELAVRDLQNKKFDELPVDGKFYKTLDAARKRGATGGASRREVLTASGAAMVLGWTAMGVAGAGGMLPMFQRFMMPNALEEPDPRVRVGSLKKYRDMAPGDVNEDFKPQGLWLIRLEDRIAALNIICTHLGCIPNWLPGDRKFLCPCHGSGYYQTGVNFQGPTPRPLERFRIFEVDGTVVVDKSRKFQYELGQWDNPDSFIAV